MKIRTMLKKRVLAATLTVTLLATALAGAGCHRNKVITDPQASAQTALIRLQGEAERLTVYADIGVQAIDQVKTSGLYADLVASVPQAARATDIARTALLEFSATAKPFVELSKTFSNLDPANKEQLKAAFEPVRLALAKLRQPVQDLVAMIVGYLNSKHLTNVDLDLLRQRIDFGFTVIDGAARLIPTWIQ